MKTKIEIKTFGGTVLFEFKTENNTIKKTVIEANLREADLYGADLYGADLYGADLRGANLYGANLYGADGLDVWWHVHHEVLYEQLNEPIRNRINYIKEHKPKKEIELRLKILRPILGKYPKDEKGWEKLHKKECEKDCPWDFKQKTIFPVKKEKQVK